MLLKDIDPFVRHIRHFTISELSPSAGKDVKTRDNRIFYVTDGDGSIRVGKSLSPLKRDSLVYVRAGVSYRITPEPKLSVIVINFDFTDDFSAVKQSFHPFDKDFPGTLEEILFDDTDAFSSHLILDSSKKYDSQIRGMLSEFHGKGEWRDAFLCATLKALFLDIARRESIGASGKNKPSQLVSDIVEYLRLHYSERVENETLAEHFHFTSVYLNRVFKREMGTSIHQYLITLRVDIAKALLSSGEYTPSEAAEAVGFDDYPHFSKTFKRLSGISPNKYHLDM